MSIEKVNLVRFASDCVFNSQRLLGTEGKLPHRRGVFFDLAACQFSSAGGEGFNYSD